MPVIGALDGADKKDYLALGIGVDAVGVVAVANKLLVEVCPARNRSTSRALSTLSTTVRM